MIKLLKKMFKRAPKKTRGPRYFGTVTAASNSDEDIEAAAEMARRIQWMFSWVHSTVSAVDGMTHGDERDKERCYEVLDTIISRVRGNRPADEELTMADLRQMMEATVAWAHEQFLQHTVGA